MSKAEQIAEAAEALFYQEGFHGTGIDRIVQAAQVTPRTLYRHYASKDALVSAVLARREARYVSRMERDAAAHATRHGDPLLALFDALAAWFGSEGDGGCMFLKAFGEYSAHEPEVAEAVKDHKQRVLSDLRRRTGEAGLDPDGGLPEQLMLLMEGATALAPILGGEVAASRARAAALTLLRAAYAESGR
ncbi:TetR/AcrR family transcriptional regulator [Marinivivus vitaminiproducens]|uniref:TetR/AcrR family transcriptional regulator n=1 Tax=Marinivivus vitaminiproducens TaxID=3035935 RepID=UPI0027A892B2|nr:TetR/AcrR family transcriptional regulator [Geminicoccaceae bacterium SCSIO 64248]